MVAEIVSSSDLFNYGLADLACAATRRGSLALLLIDVDGLNRWNYGFGHESADRMLDEVIRRISGAARDGLVARVGSNHFALAFLIPARGVIPEFPWGVTESNGLIATTSPATTIARNILDAIAEVPLPQSVFPQKLAEDWPPTDGSIDEPRYQSVRVTAKGILVVGYEGVASEFKRWSDPYLWHTLMEGPAVLGPGSLLVVLSSAIPKPVQDNP